MDYGSWNAGELRQLANKREGLLVEGIKSRVIDNGARRDRREPRRIAADLDIWAPPSMRSHPDRAQ
jgi:hypothetical protein